MNYVPMYSISIPKRIGNGPSPALKATFCVPAGSKKKTTSSGSWRNIRCAKASSPLSQKRAIGFAHQSTAAIDRPSHAVPQQLIGTRPSFVEIFIGKELPGDLVACGTGKVGIENS